MFRANRFYGHRGILAEYAGVPASLPVWGEIQHGWGLGTGGLDPTRSYPMLRKFLWSEANVRTAVELGLRGVVPIGAPFLYLTRIADGRGLGVRQGEGSRAEGTIVYPFHAWEETTVVGDHDAYVREIVDREEGPVTVVLYWLDYERPETRRLYERHGVRIRCHGRRYDPWFLWRQYEELIRHQRVVSNRVSTAVWYGASLGREVEVYGQVMGSNTESEGRRFSELQKRRWPELCEGPLAGDEARRLAMRELGGEFVRGPNELRDILGWRGARRSIGRVLSARDDLVRRLILRSILWHRWHPPPPYVSKDRTESAPGSRLP